MAENDDYEVIKPESLTWERTGKGETSAHIRYFINKGEAKIPGQHVRMYAADHRYLFDGTVKDVYLSKRDSYEPYVIADLSIEPVTITRFPTENEAGRDALALLRELISTDSDTMNARALREQVNAWYTKVRDLLNSYDSGVEY